MAESRLLTEWQRTSAEEALTINMNRTKGARAISPDELNPYVKQKKTSGKIKGEAAWKMFEHIVKSGMLAKTAKHI